MDLIAVELGPDDGADPLTAPVEISINGRRLLDLVRDAEVPGALADGQPELAGRHLSLTRYAVRHSRHFLGEPLSALSWFDDGDTGVLGCTCSDFGCAPVTVDITLHPHSVRWTHFRRGHRTWDLSSLGPFEFEWHQYRAALSVLDGAPR